MNSADKTSQKHVKKFLILDGSSLVYRAFFALPLLQTRQGFYTNAVYGFTTMLLRLLQDEQPGYIAVAFDKSKKTFRHEFYHEYKGTREKTPQELSEQFEHIRGLLKAFNISVVETDGYEADDLIGTLAVLAQDAGLTPVIVSGDADTFQLVDTADVIFTRRGITQTERYNAEALHARYGLTARQFIDFKGLKGDTSDNIPGVPGVGEKTALKLLSEFGTLDGIYANLDKVKGKLQNTLETYRDQAYLSQKLATIVTDAPLFFQPQDFEIKAANNTLLRELFARLEFTSLLAKLPDVAKDTALEQQEESHRLVPATKLRELLTLLETDGVAAVMPVPMISDWHEEPAGLAIAVAGHTYYTLFDQDKEAAIAFSLFSDYRFCCLVYDAKFWANLCWRKTGREPAVDFFDAGLAAYLLDPLENGYPPAKLAEIYLERHLPDEPGKNSADPACLRDFTCSAVRTLYDLYPILTKRLDAYDLTELYSQLELPLTQTLARMERIGVRVDTSALVSLKHEFKERIAVLETHVYELAGESFNLNSPKQLAYILFEKLGLPPLKKTKTGFSTDAQVLEELAPHHEIVADILQYRTLIKLLGTYLEGLSKLIDPQTGRIHTTFHQTVTATGRLSSSDPNLQNIPIRIEEGRRIRQAFIPDNEGSILLSADYSQIELRIMAHMSQDDVLIESFSREEDIHTRTASEVFGVPPEQVSKEMRDRAKAVNFGIIYGISDYGLSRQLGISRNEAKSYIQRYFERLPGVRRYMENIVAEARANGFVLTILNRRRYLPDINSRNFNLRGFAERTAMNTPIQGSAADIIKLAMLQVEKRLLPYGSDARMILQVHDDLVFEVKANLLHEVASIVRTEMENAIRLAVPLTVDVKCGPSWAAMQKIDLSV